MLFVNADREFTHGRAQNHLGFEHAEKIAAVYEQWREIPRFSRIVPVTDLLKTDANLNIRRWIDNAQPPEPQDVRAHLHGGVPRTEVEATAGMFAAFGVDVRGGDRAPAALVGAAGCAPARVPVAEGCRAGADRVTVVDLDASVVFASSDKENAQPTYKGGVGFCPNLATCDNTDDVLAIDPRPDGATSNCAADNIALLDLAVSRLPDRYRRRLLVGLDGAGFSHDLLDHIASGGGTKGRDWEFSVGWSCTDKEMDAIERVRTGAWTAGIDQNGDTVHDTFVADLMAGRPRRTRSARPGRSSPAGRSTRPATRTNASARRASCAATACNRARRR